MKGIDPIWLTIIATVVAIDNWIGGGKVSLDHVFPGDWIPWIVGWCGFLGGVLGFVVAALTTIISSKPGVLISPTPPSVTSTVVKVLLVAFALSMFLANGSAMAQTRLQPKPIDLVQKMKDDFTAKTGVTATGDLANDLVKALDAKLLPDLQYALKLALATKSNVTAPCWQAWIDMINTQQTAVKNSDGTEIPAPDPHLVTSFERMVELRNALQPESDFMIKCSPVASMVKKDITGFMGVVISGGAGLATLVPGL